MSELEIPESWAVSNLVEMSDIEGMVADGDWIESKDQDPNGTVRLIQLADVGDGEFRDRSSRFVTLETAMRLKCTFLSTGDILVARMPDPLGRSCIFPGDLRKCITAVDVCIVRLTPNNFVASCYVYFINSPIIRGIIQASATGTTRQRVTKAKLGNIALPVPPLGEQHRIVAKIETTFKRIEALEKAVESAASLLTKYRESLLNKAFRGELVPQDPNDEPASKLLERIRAERAKLLDGKKKKKDELPPITEDEIPFEIPKSWEWVRLGELAVNVEYGTSAKTNDAIDGVPVLRMGNLQNGTLALSNLKYLPAKHDEFPRLFLQSGDLVFNRTNSPELVGKCGIFRGEISPCSFASYLIRVAFDSTAIDSSFVATFINSKMGRNWVENVMVQQVGQANVNGTKLKECLIPVPPRKEQDRIVDALYRRQNVGNSFLAAMERSLQTVAQFRNSILSSAFSGRLVPQDPSEGTGHQLLEQILAAKASDESSKPAKVPTKQRRSKK